MVSDVVELLGNKICKTPFQPSFSKPFGVIETIEGFGGKVYKTWRRRQHKMLIYQGFGLNTSILELLLNQGYPDTLPVVIEFSTKDDQSYYIATLKDFIESNKMWKDSTHLTDDVQKFLTIDEFKRIVIK